MSADYTTAGLIQNAKRRGALPASDGLTNSTILQVLTEEARNYIPAFLKGLREEFIIAELNVTITSPTVPIPVRACGVALRTIEFLRGDGTRVPLTRVEPERRGEWAFSGSEPTGFMFQGDNAILLPAVSSGTLVVSYQQRPGQLVLPTDCAQVVAMVGPNVFASNVPASFALAAQCDFVKGTPNFKLLAMDQAIAGTLEAGPYTEIQFASLPTGLAIGDFVCLATETCIPQMPLECFDLLACAAALRLARSVGSSRVKDITDELKDLREQVTQVLAPRADGSARVIVSRSRLGRRWF